MHFRSVRNQWHKWRKSQSGASGHRPRQRAGQGTYRPRLEPLEGRLLLSSYFVNSPGDEPDIRIPLPPHDCDAGGHFDQNGTYIRSGLCTLRAAIQHINAEGEAANTIAFKIGSGAQTITIADLDPIKVSVTIDGTTQPGFAGTPLIQLVASGGAFYGFDIRADGSTVKGLAFGGFTRAGINLHSNGNKVEGNYIGTDLSGKVALPNTDGVRIIAGSNNIIGGLTDAQRNLISGNTNDGVVINGAEGPAKMNIVEHNYIGTDGIGAAPLPNGVNGVEILVNAAMNTIGGTAGDATRNVISGNGSAGVNGGAGAPGNVVMGNYIGTDKDGTGKLSNPVGVLLSGGSYTIGGTAAGARNIISGNTVGIQISFAAFNLVQGNCIGTDKTGTAPLGNATGVAIVSAADNTIGDDNLISGNTGFGVILIALSLGNKLQGNQIGTNAAGTASLPNGSGGVLISSSSRHNLIGGTAAGEGNCIEGNATVGILITDAGTTFNFIVGNTIGGAGVLANGGDGVLLAGGCSFNTIGGAAQATANVISGNAGAGVHITGAATMSNQVGGNLIGTNAAGMAPLSNFDGVALDDGANNNTIGGFAVKGLIGNTISGNRHEGIRITGKQTMANVVLHNFIGTNASGTLALPNLDDGVLISDAPGNQLGDNNGHEMVTLGYGNLISGNTNDGIAITGGNAAGNLVQSNFIGIDLNNAAKISNGANGVRIDGAPANVLGQDPKGVIGHYRNAIAGNGANGVSISGIAADGTVISANYIGTYYGGEAPLGNVGDGVRIDSAPNTLMTDIGSDPGIVISANGRNGVEILTAQGTRVTKSAIGTDLQRKIPFPNGVDGVRIDNGSNSLIKGNEISGNKGEGVHILGLAATGNNLVSNNIGYHFQAPAPLPNGQNGVLIEQGAFQNCIGDATSGNIISGNLLNGVEIFGFFTDGNLVQGNYIGTDGFQGLANGTDGVSIRGGAAHNTIGGAAALPGQRPGNVIAGNARNGVEINASNGNLVEGNLIGNIVRNDGVFGLPNGLDGVLVSFGAANNTIGGIGVGLCNIISGNSMNGVEIAGAATNANLVQNNKIGVDINGVVLANGKDGVRIAGGATNNIIGNVGAGLENVISGNNTATGNGVEITGAGTTGNVVQHNFIGTNASGADGLGNGKDGVLITGGAANNTVGGGGNGAGNIISGNGANGVEISGPGTMKNVVQNNYIGTDPMGKQGKVPLRNRKDGVLISGGAANNTIGGAGRGGADGQLVHVLSNLISDNGANGVEITGAGTKANLVLLDVIGTDVSGLQALGNGALGGGDGVLIGDGATNNQIGGPLGGAAGVIPGFENIISGNFGNGIRIVDPLTTGNLLLDNFVGTDNTGQVALPNDLDGVLIDNAPANTVGAAFVPGFVPVQAANIISGNGANGIEIKGMAATANIVFDNAIGVSFIATALGNTGSGVLVKGAAGNTIGPMNTIAFNGKAGATPQTGGVVVLDDPALPPGNGTGNRISRNSIFGNIGLGIDLAGDGVTLNDSRGHNGPNHFQNFPVLTSAVFDGQSTIIMGFLESNPTAHEVQLFSGAVKDASGYGQGRTYLGGVFPDAKAHANFTFTVQANLLGLFITATATDITPTATGLQNDTSEFSGAIEVIVPRPKADLALTKTAAASVAEGANLTYTITVHNNGPSAAMNVVVTDVLPANASFVSANFGAAPVRVSGNTVTVSLGILTNGATVQGTIVVQTLEEGALANMASVTSDTMDPNPSNNSQTAATTVFDPAVLGTSAKVSATAGAPFSGPVATFTDPGGAEPNPADPSGTIDDHYQVVSIDWGDGTALDTTSGTLRYSGSPGSKTAPFTISGSHTYAADASYTITILIKHEGVITTVTSPAMVVSLGLFIGPRLTKPINFWSGLLGQELITRFGLTSIGQTVGQWLATTLPKLYGGRNGAPNLSTFSNAQVAAFYTTLFNKSTMLKLDAKVLATALDIYATTLSLGGTLAQSYGFTVSTVGLGAYSIDIGLSGPALGVPNHTVLNVFQVLMATNNSAVGGEPWDTDTMRRNQLLSVFNRITG